MNTTWTVFRDVMQILSFAAIILGIPAGLIQYFFAKRKEQRDREYGTYNALDEKYLAYQEYCLGNPELDVFDVPDSHPANLTE